MKRKNKKIKANPPKWKICTEGVTEANYLYEYAKLLGIDKYIRINCKNKKDSGCGLQHEKLFDKMQNCLKNTIVYEKTFLVHDYDKAAEQKEAKISFNNTFKRANDDANFHVIYSNPCIEYWLMLHLAYNDSDLHRSNFQEMVKNVCNRKREEQRLEPLHDDKFKTDPCIFCYFGGKCGSNQARKHALKRFNISNHKKIINKSFSSECYSIKAPYTNMFELLDELDQYAKKFVQHNKFTGSD